MLLKLDDGRIISVDKLAEMHQQNPEATATNVFASKEAFTAYLTEHTQAGAYSVPIALQRLPDDELHFLVPPGIGDVAWVWAKWQSVQREREERGLKTTWWFPPDEPFRVLPYADLVGMHTADMGAGRGKLPGLHTHWMLQTAGDPGAAPENGVLVLHANKHLEAGKPLEEWCPYLPVGKFLPDGYDAKTDMEAPMVVHMAHAGYMEGNLLAGMWARMLRHLSMIHEPGVLLVGGNSGDDFRFAKQVLELKASQWGRARPVSPRTQRVHTMFDAPLSEVLRWTQQAPATIGMASGLEILAVGQGAPTLLAYPRWLEHMPGTWEPKDTSKQAKRSTWVFTDELYEWVMGAACVGDLASMARRWSPGFRRGVL